MRQAFDVLPQPVDQGAFRRSSRAGQVAGTSGRRVQFAGPVQAVAQRLAFPLAQDFFETMSFLPAPAGGGFTFVRGGEYGCLHVA